MPQISCISKFNTGPFETWRSAFRESVKLMAKGDQESMGRLHKWLHPLPDADYSEDAKLGAQQGQQYAVMNLYSDSDLNKINDWEWLHELYRAR